MKPNIIALISRVQHVRHGNHDLFLGIFVLVVALLFLFWFVILVDGLGGLITQVEGLVTLVGLHTYIPVGLHGNVAGFLAGRPFTSSTRAGNAERSRENPRTLYVEVLQREWFDRERGIGLEDLGIFLWERGCAGVSSCNEA